ncbi:MAG: MalY/PatB family protein [Pleomorphochaeta sp.]
MKYDFDTIVDRRNTNSLKWDVKENELPMWVADMDFKTAPCAIESLNNRVNHGVFGYSIVPDSWYDAYIKWWKERHNFEIEKQWLIFSTGVVPAISSIVRKLTTVAENVVIQSPVYNIFYNSIINNGRKVLESPLVYDDGKYSIDFEDLREKLSNPQTTLMILCNPHNPVGKIWDKETLIKIGKLCKENNVVVLSDEIHCDITIPNKTYIPFASVNEECKQNSVTCISPTKAFNLAGMQSSAVMIANKFLRDKVERGLNTDEVAEPNVFATTVATAAFNEGGPWLDALRKYISDNKDLVTDYIEKNIPEIKVVDAEATYLMWLDCKTITSDCEKLAAFIREETGLYLTAGNHYGKGGEGFLRMNVACSKKVVTEALKKLDKAIKKFYKKLDLGGNLL